MMEKFTGYEVTKDGRVFSVGTNWRGYGKREMRQTPNADGYLYSDCLQAALWLVVFAAMLIRWGMM